MEKKVTLPVDGLATKLFHTLLCKLKKGVPSLSGAQEEDGAQQPAQPGPVARERR